MTSRFIKIWVLLLCGFFTAATFAQNANSTIKGTVQDTSGAVVPGATITLTDVGTGQTLTTTSKGNGFYVFTNLAPANYRVSANVRGFARWVGVLTLRVSQDAEVDPQLTAASVSTKVTVRDVTPVIDRVNPTLSDVKNSTAIATVPVLNRNILGVLAFSPGVVAGGIGGAGAGNTRINGMPPGSVNYLVDGQTATNRNTNELQLNAQPTPTFQEVKVITSNGGAQYSSPGVVQLVTKSGTNHFHGQIYELNRNDHLQAKIFNQTSIPYLQHNEYGAQLGGPVWFPKIYNGRNKTFFFADVEWIKENANRVEHYVLPTMAERQGNLSDLLTQSTGDAITVYDPNTTAPGAAGPYTRTAFGGNIIPSSRLNPVAQKVFGLTPVAGLVPLPEPNVAVGDIWNGGYNYDPPSAKTTTDNHIYTFKVDQLFGPNRLSARYTYSDSKVLKPESYAPEEPDQAEYGGHNGSLSFTKVISPKAINVAHVGIQYNNHVHSGPVPIVGVQAALGLPTYQTDQYWPQFYYNHYGYDIPDSYWSPADRDNPKDYPDQTISASDQFSYNKGNHQLVFGFDFNNYRVITRETGQPGGNYETTGFFTAQQDNSATGGVDIPVNDTGSGLADFLLGEASGLSVAFYPVYHTRQSAYDGYANDDWRLSQNLTVNLGVRYEYWTAFSDASGLTSTFDPNIAGGMVVYQGNGALPAQTSQSVYSAFQQVGLPIESAAAAGYPSSLFNMPKNNWEPRVGFAYQLDNRTVLRGGYGIYHFAFPLIAYQQATRKNPPFYYQAALAPGMVNGVAADSSASQLEFPIATAEYGGPQPVNQYMLGMGCSDFPAGTCNPPGFVVNPGNAAQSILSNSGNFPIEGLDPNYKPSVVQEYNLTFAREFPFHTGFSLSYIGNHSSNLLMIDPLNALLPQLSCTSPDAPNCTTQELRLYPLFASPVDYYRYDGYANTNELQAKLTHTYGNGLTLQTYFTWMKALTTSEFGLSNGGAPGGQSNTNTMVPSALTAGYNVNTIGSGAPIAQRIRAVYTNDPTLPTKTFQLNAHYELPLGRGKRFMSNAHGILNSAVSGFNISAFFLWHSGFYFAPYYNQLSTSAAGGRSINLAPGKTGILPPGQRTAAEWFDPSIYDPNNKAGAPYAGQTYILGPNLNSQYLNNIPPNYMTGPGYNNLDATVYKVTPIWRNLKLDFEAQFLNVYNHQNLGMPSTTSGIITTIAGGQCANGACPRTIQLQAKIMF